MKVQINNQGAVVFADYTFTPEEISKIEEIRALDAPLDLGLEVFLRDTKSTLMSSETLVAVSAIIRHLKNGFPNTEGFKTR